VVMDFYKCYRAMVRCKVNCIRISSQGTDHQCPPELIAGARDYLRLAHGYARRFARPTLWVFCGLPASGKSALAAELAAMLAIAMHNSDRIRKSMHGLDPLQQVQGPTDKGIYAPEVGARVYAHLLAAARKAVREGFSVILDATYSSSTERQKLIHLAAVSGARIVFAECRAPKAVLRSRLKARDHASSVSDARLAHFDSLKARFEPLTEIQPGQHVVIDTTQRSEACLRDLFAAVELDEANHLPGR
jgi:predicted kinase